MPQTSGKRVADEGGRIYDHEGHAPDAHGVRDLDEGDEWILRVAYVPIGIREEAVGLQEIFVADPESRLENEAERRKEAVRKLERGQDDQEIGRVDGRHHDQGERMEAAQPVVEKHVGDVSEKQAVEGDGRPARTVNNREQRRKAEEAQGEPSAV